MNREDFSDEEWQEVFDEFRLLVVRAGYSDWDASAMEALADETGEAGDTRYERVSALPAAGQLHRYAAAFMRFLKARSRTARDDRRGQLGRLLHSESGAPVEDFMVDFEGRERAIFGGDDDPDGMIATLANFLAELDGDDGAFWNEDIGDGEGDA